MRYIYIVTVLLVLLLQTASQAQVRTSDSSVVIRNGKIAQKVMLTVLPVAGPDTLSDQRFALFESLHRSLGASNMFHVVPYKLTVETVWQYFPSFLSVNPHDVAQNSDDVELIGQLGLLQKEQLALTLACNYVVDGVVVPSDEEKSVARVDLFDRSAKKIVASFKAKVAKDKSYYDIGDLIAQKIEGYFFNLFSDDLVLDILNRITGHQVSLEDAINELDGLIETYPDNQFVWCGVMIVNFQLENSDMVITAGERWLTDKDKHAEQQIRFFSACNENPYYILGKTYMKKYNYKRAEQILYMGYQTYPYATEMLKKDLVVCLRLLGKHQKADLIETKKE